MAHLGTHARLVEQDVNDCHLVLARGEKLTLGALYGLAGRYPASMTVLSACETALGRNQPGSEVSYLADGFVEAGSSTIVASLWPVSDAATAAWMQRFYREIRAGKSRGEAKRLAEVALLRSKRTAHPYFWAPFILLGDWR